MTEGGRGQFSEASCYVTNIIVVCVGGIIQSVTSSMPGKLNSTCVLVLLFIFKLHFLKTTIVSLMDSVEYTYQGFIQWEASPGIHPRILGVE